MEKLLKGSIKMEINIFWTVVNFFDLLKELKWEAEKNWFRSSDFLLNSKEYHIGFHDSSLGCYFFVKPDDAGGLVKGESFNIKVKKNDGSFYINETARHESFPFFGTWTFIRKKDLLALKDNLTNDGSLTVHVTYTSLSNRQDIPQIISLQGYRTLSRDFKSLLTGGYNADIAFKVGKKEIEAHKCVFAARAPAFYNLFLRDTLKNINISDCDAVTFKCFLSFLYSGQIDQIPSSRLFGLYEYADKYKLPHLKKACVKRFIIEMSMDTVCDALRVTALHDEEQQLLEAATNFFINNAEMVSVTQNWKSFLKTNSELGNELFRKCLIARPK